MAITVKIKSSSRDEPYNVSVFQRDAGLVIHCDCPAGEWGKFCKHKLALISGDDTILFNQDERAAYMEIADMISKSNFPLLVRDLEVLESEMEKIKRKVKKQKETMELKMKEGDNYGN